MAKLTETATHMPGPRTFMSGETLACGCSCRRHTFGYRMWTRCRLHEAAFNSYTKHCGTNAVKCAKGDLLGEALEACKIADDAVCAATYASGADQRTLNHASGKLRAAIAKANTKETA